MFVGRWQPLHKGHLWLINERLKEGKHAIQSLNYYRVLRNWVAHPSARNLKAAQGLYSKERSRIGEFARQKEISGAPKEPENVSLQDTKLFCAISLEAAVSITESFDPGNQKIATLISSQYEPNVNWSSERTLKSTETYARVNFGISSERAKSIAGLVYAQ